MLNKVVIMGRITRDLEKRVTPSGISVMNFTLAVDRDFQKQGEEKQTDFVPCTAFRHNADFLEKWSGKGRMIVVEGKLQIDKYTDKDGNNRTAPNVVADNVYFADSKRSDDGQQSKPQTFEEVASEDDGDLPF